MYLGIVKKFSKDITLPEGLVASQRTEWLSPRQRLYNATSSVVRSIRTFFEDRSTRENQTTAEDLQKAYHKLSEENKLLATENLILQKSNEAYSSSYQPEDSRPTLETVNV